MFTPHPTRDDTWIVSIPIDFILYNGHIITIPVGFETNFATVPKCLQFIFKPDNREYLYATVLHDYLYENGYKLGYDRKFADTQMFVNQSQTDTNLLRRIAMYLVVRLFGNSHYNYGK